MDKVIIYPTAEKIIEYNLLALTLIKVKKADRTEVLSRGKLDYIVERCKNIEGDIYDKAVFLFKSLIQQHPFASGNKRTAFIITKEFLTENNEKFKIEDDPSQAKIMIGIRHGYYTDQEIKRWLQHGKIREFKRR